MNNKIEFYIEVGRLKSLLRTGWVKRGIPNPENVSSHMYRSQFIAYDFAKALGENPEQCVMMMMVHDLPEAKAGDITPHCNVSREEKARLELNSAKQLAKLSDNPEFLDLFLEYEEGKTVRARLCHDSDQLECLTQAFEYSVLYPDKRESLEDFWPYARAKITTDVGVEMYNQLNTQKLKLALV